MAKHRSATVTGPLHIRKILSAASVFAVAIFFGLAATGGTYALWNTQAPVSGASVTTGSTVLKINDLALYPVPALSPAKLYPGRSVLTAAPLTFSNTGTTALSFTSPTTVVTVSPAFTGQVDIALISTTNATCAPAAEGATPVSTPTVSIAPGANVKMCVEMRLKTSAPASLQGQTATFSVAVNATQVRP